MCKYIYRYTLYIHDIVVNTHEIYIYVRLSLPGKPKKFISGLHQTALTSNSTTQQLPELGPKSPKSCQFALMIII